MHPACLLHGLLSIQANTYLKCTLVDHNSEKQLENNYVILPAFDDHQDMHGSTSTSEHLIMTALQIITDF